ncbi:STAS domain-containing protein [Paraflavitalea soli]|uniref:STAS domain-containing protein n=1 Tax=Paraflavitalea soli TaxID=2315862 RepID=A0A3B7MPE2_9BACT|nr:STAS domain-containing protein [Paraflavitalea soli]AXY75183.1 STAS domain-containing protein [Paraflavitalea soli]
MQVKIDTKQKFHAITLIEPVLTANMTAELDECLLPFLQNDVKNVILIVKDINELDDAAGEYLLKIQQTFYEQGASFVICELQPSVEDALDRAGILEMMNVTPTESEAWDIVQLEEIERELMGGE